MFRGKKTFLVQFFRPNGSKRCSKRLKRCSNHPPYTLELELNMTYHSKQRPQIFAFAKADWIAVKERIVQKPFSPYCFSNIDELLRQWYS